MRRQLATAWLCIWGSVFLLNPTSATAAGWGKRKQECCPTYPSAVAPSDAAATDPAAPVDPSAPPADQVAPDTSAALESELTGEYDVAASPNLAAPNMIGDFLGNGGLTFNGIGLGLTPGQGGGVGRIKFSEYTSVIPQDRVYFGWQYYDSVPLAGGGTDVHRFLPGIEKTFFNGATSVEVRVPFASTVDAAQDLSALGSTDVELGNVTVFFKSLLYQRNACAVGAGLVVTTPTSDDLSVTSQGVEQMRMENESVHLAPYVGLVYAPGRLFSQLYLQYDVAANGQPVYFNQGTAGPSSMAFVGDFTDESVGFADFNVGYWIYRDNCCDAWLTGIAPVFEAHYSGGVGNGDAITAFGSTINEANDSFDIVNLVVGTHVEFNQRTLLTVGYGFPLREAPNRQSEYEVKVFLNHRFGPGGTRVPPSF